MFCGECGTQNEESRNFCKNCGKALRKTQPVAAAAPAAPAPAVQQPAGIPPVQSPVSAVPQQAAAAPAPAKPPLNKALLGLAILGIVLGIVSWFRYPYLCGLLAVVIGAAAIAKSENRRGAVAIAACLAILIGLACIVVDLFYLTIFPVPKPVF